MNAFSGARLWLASRPRGIGLGEGRRGLLSTGLCAGRSGCVWCWHWGSCQIDPGRRAAAYYGQPPARWLIPTVMSAICPSPSPSPSPPPPPYTPPPPPPPVSQYILLSASPPHFVVWAAPVWLSCSRHTPLALPMFPLSYPLHQLCTAFLAPCALRQRVTTIGRPNCAPCPQSSLSSSSSSPSRLLQWITAPGPSRQPARRSCCSVFLSHMINLARAAPRFDTGAHLFGGCWFFLLLICHYLRPKMDVPGGGWKRWGWH